MPDPSGAWLITTKNRPKARPADTARARARHGTGALTPAVVSRDTSTMAPSASRDAGEGRGRRALAVDEADHHGDGRRQQGGDRGHHAHGPDGEATVEQRDPGPAEQAGAGADRQRPG